MKIAMTADELKTMTEDVVDEAIDSGWLFDVYDKDAIDILCMVERALASLGIEIVECEDEDEDDDFEELDFDDEEEEEEEEELPSDKEVMNLIIRVLYGQ